MFFSSLIAIIINDVLLQINFIFDMMGGVL